MARPALAPPTAAAFAAPPWVEERLEAAEQADLERWAERVLEAESLEAVFAA